ncbi:tumor necrosis factor receptor superfamily member 16 isoform X2 [Scleropages formosus]|uniref:tumor necrosis factor receptor superfamily member 16 isoform X2 n=1 Tax=Scleropages formosus TaxID=113540 RepID=UPI000878FA97|nr:tumor necrosis factor receptor superfamily member 16-like isoform X2 [Scleropages formosus]
MLSRGTALALSTLALVLTAARGDHCASGLRTSSGECCRLCPPGQGLAVECARENTKCQPCQDGVTTSLSEDLSPCLPCVRCPPGVPETARCTASQDTQCDCSDGFYLRRMGNTSEAYCAPCSLCRLGQGAVRACGPLGNTLCEPCAPGTFSEERSSFKACQRCSRCQQNEVEIRPCQPDSNTICMEKKLHILSQPAESDGPRRPVNGEDRGGDEASPAPGAPRFTPQEEGGKNIIPVYVSVLAAVVLGLLLYVAYKCWTSCKQKQALGKARSGDAGVAPEGEKLHSDSGVFLDSHSLQDSQLSKGSKRDSKPDSRLYLNLPPHRQEEVEQLLQEGGDWSWRQLATQLGYEQERLDVFGRGEDPVHTLLSDWATQEGSTLGVLCSALTRIDRPDVASALCCPTQGSSVV